MKKMRYSPQAQFRGLSGLQLKRTNLKEKGCGLQQLVTLIDIQYLKNEKIYIYINL